MSNPMLELFDRHSKYLGLSPVARMVFSQGRREFAELAVKPENANEFIHLASYTAETARKRAMYPVCEEVDEMSEYATNGVGAGSRYEPHIKTDREMERQLSRASKTRALRKFAENMRADIEKYFESLSQPV